MVNLKSVTLRSASIAVVALVIQTVHVECRAESLQLDTFTPKVSVYKVSLDPDVTVSADITTTRFAVHTGAEIDISDDMVKLTNDAIAISQNALPVKVKGGPCDFEIQSVSNLQLSVTGNTGILSGTAYVDTTGCPLSSGLVTVSARFIPVTTSTKLSLKVFGVQVQVPFSWSFAGAVLAQKPEALIEAKIEALAGVVALTAPQIDHVKVAFQGASISSKGQSIIVAVRSDALIDKQAITSALTKWDAFRNFSITYP